MAQIRGACVAVIAVDRLAGGARRVDACVLGGAGVAVVAHRVVGGRRAAGRHRAGVVGAAVAVVADHGLAGSALTRSALVAAGAGVAVVAGLVVWRALAAGAGVAILGRARVAVIAQRRGAGLADPGDAVVRAGAGAAVVASAVIVGGRAADLAVAAVIRAWVAVVAERRTAGAAFAVGAMVTGRACVAVGARVAVGDVNATRDGVATVVGARVAIVAVDHRARGAAAASAVVACRAHAAVAAVVVVGGGGATGRRIAGLVGAGVAVGASDRLARLTSAAAAGVASGAGVTVVAGAGRVGVHTPLLGITGVAGAGQAVVTVDERSRKAEAATTGVAGGAGVAIVTCAGDRAVAAAAGGVASVLGTRLVVATDDLSAGFADAGATGVDRRAGVAVIAGEGPIHGYVPTAGDRLASIIGAQVAVVACGRRADTRAELACVAGGAGAAVVAIEGLVGEDADASLATGLAASLAGDRHASCCLAGNGGIASDEVDDASTAAAGVTHIVLCANQSVIAAGAAGGSRRRADASGSADGQETASARRWALCIIDTVGSGGVASSVTVGWGDHVVRRCIQIRRGIEPGSVVA